MNNANLPNSLAPAGAAAGIATPPQASFLRGANSLNALFGARIPSQGPLQPVAPEIQRILDTPLSWFIEDAGRRAEPGELPLTQVAFVLDESSSMETGKGATIEGYNTQLNVVRKGAEMAGETQMTLVKFASGISVEQVAQPVGQVPALTEKTFKPNGYTALYDGIGETIAALLRQPRSDSVECATLVTVFTDGDENASRTYTAAMIQDVVRKLEATGRWTFALVGPRLGVAGLADLLAVDKSNVTGFEPASVNSRVDVMGQMSAASTTYMSLRATGMKQAKSLYAGIEG